MAVMTSVANDLFSNVRAAVSTGQMLVERNDLFTDLTGEKFFTNRDTDRGEGV